MFCVRCAVAVMVVWLGAAEVVADVVYQSDFQSGDTSLWSSSELSTDELGKTVLGLFKQATVCANSARPSCGRIHRLVRLRQLQHMGWAGRRRV